MLLTSIQIQGFKSFADKTVLKFGRGVTAVVGPNGSGKSNISDAVRWVLGEQSTKSLRGQSMEDVIFGGTENRRPHGFCEVTLNIDNSDRSLNFDNDSVAVTRRYYRSHESEYLINNVTVRLKDIHELFMDTGLGRDGYSMIGQGRIDNIIRSKSDERRDIFEEAAGISKYRYRKEDACRKLAAAEDNLLRLKDISDELESRVGPLAEQSRKAERFLDLAADKKKYEIGLWLYTLRNAKDALREQENKISAAQMRYREINDALSDFDRKTEENAAEFARLTAEIEAQRAAISADMEDAARIRGNIGVIENDIGHNAESIARLEAERSGLCDSDAAANLEMQEKTAAAAAVDLQVQQADQSIQAAEANLAGLLADSEQISCQIAEQANSLNRLSAQIADCRVEMTTAQSALEELAGRSGTVEEQMARYAADIVALKTEFDETEALLKEIDASIETAANTLKGYEIRLQSREQSVEELRQKSENIHLDIEAKKRRVQILTELDRNMEGFSGAVKKVIAEADKGLLRGIRGTISKLITVDKKYTIAVETALGNAIQDVIVETEADAKRAIAFLKNNNGGRATFLPISSITARDFKENDMNTVFGYVGIASDLVSCDASYREIIRCLLGGTVVTEDIDSAVTLAKKYNYRVKVVSLDGQVINPGGSLTGGSLVKQAGLLSRSADIKRLTDEIAHLQAEAANAKKSLAEATEKAAAVRADITAVRADLTTANEDKIRTLSEMKRLSDLSAAAEQSLKGLTEEQTKSNEKAAEYQAIITRTQADFQALDAEKNHLQQEVDRLTGGRADIADKREALSAEITAEKLKKIELQKTAEQYRLAAQLIQQAAGNRAQRATEIAAEIAALQFRNEQLRKDIESAQNDAEDILLKNQACEEKIAALGEQRNSAEKAGVALRIGEREQTGERERIGGELARLTERREMMLQEQEDVVRRLYDEYQLTRTEAEAVGTEIEKPAEAKKILAEIKSEIRALGNVNVSAIEEYREVSQRFEFLSAQIADVEASRTELHKLIHQLTTQMQELFREAFEKINENFSVTFKDLFGGGTARLTLSNPDDVLESGIDIEAKLPGKNVPSLEGLSGGEKALVALSIYFAIMQVNAPPFCFLDEVDTALDDINVDRFADYMKQSRLPTQFICVTHRRGTMEVADMLYGVTMQEKGVTKLLELDVARLEKMLLSEHGA